MPSDSQSNDPDLDAIAAETRDEIDKGEGTKHLQDVFDEIASKQGDASHIPADLRDRLNRFALAFKAGLSDQLVGNERGLVCKHVGLDGLGRGFVCVFTDPRGRPFTVEVSYDDGFAMAAQKGNEEMGRGLMDLVLQRLLIAHDRYFERMRCLD